MLDCHLNLVWEQLEEVHHPKKSYEKKKGFKISMRKSDQQMHSFYDFSVLEKNSVCLQALAHLEIFCCNFLVQEYFLGKRSGAQQFSSMQAKEVYFLKSLGKNGRQLKVYPCVAKAAISLSVEEHKTLQIFSLPGFPIYNIDETFTRLQTKYRVSQQV